MTMKRCIVFAGALAFLVGTAMRAAPAQAPGTERPGQATRGQVWIENRGRSESIPIVATAPLPVVVQNPIRPWEYQILSVGAGISPADLTRLLAVQGLAGWETAGVQVSSGPNTLIVLKRPKAQGTRE